MIEDPIAARGLTYLGTSFFAFEALSTSLFMVETKLNLPFPSRLSSSGVLYLP